MAFEKGNNFGKGRKVGSKNRTTIEIRQYLTDFVGNNIDELNEAFKELEARDKIKFLIDITKFVIPTLKAVGNEIDELSEEQFNKLVEKVKAEYSK